MNNKLFSFTHQSLASLNKGVIFYLKCFSRFLTLTFTINVIIINVLQSRLDLSPKRYKQLINVNVTKLLKHKMYSEGDFISNIFRTGTTASTYVNYVLLGILCKMWHIFKFKIVMHRPHCTCFSHTKFEILAFCRSAEIKCIKLDH